MRRLITTFTALILRIFFRDIEVIGLHRVPEKGAVLFVLNHPSGLIDPLFILTLAPRPVTFLAKSTLFNMPVVGWFTRGLDAIPVYRPQDPGSAADKNRKTFAQARKLLAHGKSIAIFPEGTSHSDPALKPLKSGAARIALGAKLDRLWIAPAGLYYTSKGIFRSSVLLLFGEPFEVAARPGALDADGEPSREAVNELTERFRLALSEVLLQAERRETLALVERAEAIYSGVAPEQGPAPRMSLGERFERRRAFMARYRALQTSAPKDLAVLEDRLKQFDSELAAHGLSPADLAGRHVRRRVVLTALTLLVTSPVIVLGIVIHYPAYRLVGFLAKRLAKTEEDLIATIKVLSAMLFFPLSWILAAVFAWRACSLKTGTAMLAVAPLSGYAALLAVEQAGRVLERLHGIRYAWAHPMEFAQLRTEASAIHEHIRGLA